MAIKVNNTAENREGLSIPSGYLIGFDVIIPDNTKTLEYSPTVYISELARAEGKSPTYPTFFNKLLYSYKPTEEEFANLNPLSVNKFYQTYLESLSEVGLNTEIIL